MVQLATDWSPGCMATRITGSMNLQPRVKAIISLGLFLILSASSAFSEGRWQGNPAHRDAGPVISFGARSMQR